MKVTVVCPNCKEEILVDGVKLVVDGGAPKMGAIKSYIGWGGGNKGKLTGSVPIPPPTPPKDDTKELDEALDLALKKHSNPPIDKELHNYLKEENKRDMANQTVTPYIPVVTPPIMTITGNNPTPPISIPPPPPIVGPSAATPSIVKIDKPIKLPDESDSYKTLRIDNTVEDARDIIKKEAQKERTDVNLSTATIDAIGREIAKRIAEFKAKGTCLICNINQGNKENLICDQCLQGIVSKKVQEEHKAEELKRVVW